MKNSIVYVINRNKLFSFFAPEDRKALVNIYDGQTDVSDLEAITEREIRNRANQAKTLLDATGINYIPLGRMDITESKSMKWKRTFANDIITNVRRRLS